MDTAGVVTKKGPEEKSERNLLSPETGQRCDGDGDADLLSKLSKIATFINVSDSLEICHHFYMEIPSRM